MRISKSLSLMLAAAFCMSLAARADDNAAQAAARTALMQKMQEMDSNQSNNPAAVPENQALPPAATPAPENVAPQETPAPETPPPPALLPPQPPTPSPPVPVVVAPLAMTNSVSPSVPPLNVEIQNVQPTNALPVLNEMSEPPPTTMPAPAKKTGFFSRILHPFHHTNRPAVVEEQRMKPVAPAYSGRNNSGFAPIEPPPAPVSPDKEAELQALLEKYKADQITPDQYQMERAEILNAP